MRRRTSRRVPLVVVVTTASAVLVAGVTWAYLVGTGEGSASARTGAGPATVSLAPGTAAGDLYPGGSGTVRTVVRNPGSTPVRLDSFTLDTTRGSSGFAVGSSTPGCPASMLTFPRQDGGADGWTVPARRDGTDGTLTVTLASSLQMAVDAPDACQGASITVYLVAGT